MSMFYIPPPNEFDFYIDQIGSSPVQGKVNLPRTLFATASLFNYNPVPSDFIPFTLNGTTLWFLDPHKCEALFNRHFDNCHFIITAAHNHNPASVDPILTFYISDAKYYELSMPPAHMGEYKDLIYNPLKVSLPLNDLKTLIRDYQDCGLQLEPRRCLSYALDENFSLKDQEDVELWTFKNLWGIDDGSDDSDSSLPELISDMEDDEDCTVTRGDFVM
ncbi:hypothetical protein BU17DRAFT_83205 [Hysterangium stoloniferum]|nr:hypothetical protein BU17DRAFT_83205 [Hysterangium stoloniferum]